jgi:hypothetical protein
VHDDEEHFIVRFNRLYLAGSWMLRIQQLVQL